MKRSLFIFILIIASSIGNAQEQIIFQSFTQYNAELKYQLLTNQCARENDPFGYLTHFTLESNGTNEMLYVYSPDLYQLRAYDMSEFSLKTAFYLNHIEEISAGEQFLSMDIKLNKAVLMFTNKLILLTIGENAVTFDRSFDLNNFQGWYEQFSVNSEPQFKVRFIDDENVAMISTRYDVSVNSPEFYSGNIEVIINVINGNKTFVPVTYPENYRTNYYGLALMPMREINSNGEHVFSYMASDKVHVWNPILEKQVHYTVKSTYETEPFTPLARDLVSNTGALLQAYIDEPLYTNLVYDKYRNIYYRFFRTAIADKDACSPCNISDKSLSIMILSEDFKIKDELYFERALYEERLAFVTEAGLYLPVNMQHLENAMNKYFSFDVLTIEDKHVFGAYSNPLKLQTISNGIFSVSGKWAYNGTPIIRVYTLQGNEVYRNIYTEHQVIDISDFGKGIFMISVSDDASAHILRFAMPEN